MDAMAKPKKVLSEAQRLAFLKGREKRMANIEKKRLEKEEASLAAEEFTLPEAPPKPKPKAKAKTPIVEDSTPAPIPETKIEDIPDPAPVPETVAPPPKPEPAPAPAPTPQFNEDAFLEKIVGKLKQTIAPDVPQVKRRAPRKTRAVKVPDQEDPIMPKPMTNNFSWL